MAYIIATENGELYHHGIPGQKWGERNGPPYPLLESKKSEAERSKSTKLLTDNNTANPRLMITKKLRDTDVSDHITSLGRILGLKTRGTRISSKESCTIANDGNWSKHRGQKEWDNNCAHSVISDIMNDLGFAVKAKPMGEFELGGLMIEEIGNYFKGAKPHKIENLKPDNDVKTTIANHILKDVGRENGAMGMLRFSPKNGRGHFVKWKNENGSIAFYNSQTGEQNCNKWFNGIAKNVLRNSVEFTRLDNCEPRAKVLECVENRDD